MLKLRVIVSPVTSIGKRANSLYLGDGGAVSGALHSGNNADVKVACYPLLFTLLTDREVNGREVWAVAQGHAVREDAAAEVEGSGGGSGVAKMLIEEYT